MIKNIFNIIKKLIVAVLLIYAFNKMAVSLDLLIPINIFTVLLVMLCGIPSIIMLVMYLIIFV